MGNRTSRANRCTHAASKAVTRIDDHGFGFTVPVFDGIYSRTFWAGFAACTTACTLIFIDIYFHYYLVCCTL